MSDRMISASDRGFLLGDGIFDTSMVLNGRMMFRDRHLKRLQDAADALDIKLDLDAINAAIDTAIDQMEAARLRVSVSRSVNNEKASIQTLISPMDASRQFRSVKAITSDIVRAPGAPSAQFKTLSYIDNTEALRRAQAVDADTALMLNTFGRPASAAMENLFLLEGDTLITPPSFEGALAGTMRAWILDEASEVGLRYEERAVSKDLLTSSDAIFLTNSLRLIAPVSHLNGRQLLQTWPKQLVDLAHHLLHAIKRQCEVRTPFGRPRYNDPLNAETVA